jgi:hypothetical protein
LLGRETWVVDYLADHGDGWGDRGHCDVCVGLQGFGVGHVASKEDWVVLGKGSSEGEGKLGACMCGGEERILIEGFRRHGDEGYMDGWTAGDVRPAMP